MKRVAITGANGFIGRRLVEFLSQQKQLHVVAIQRNAPSRSDSDRFSGFQIPDYSVESAWNSPLKSVDAMVHLAGVIGEGNGKSYQRDNVELTNTLVRKCAQAGVSKFVFLSSLSVYKHLSPKTTLNPTTLVDPIEAYPKSKLACEKVINAICNEHGMISQAIRPPMIIGPEATGTFFSMAKLCGKTGISPFGCVKNRYPILQLESLLKFILHLLLTEDRPGVFIPKDTGYFAISDIIRQVWFVKEHKKLSMLDLPINRSLLRLAFGLIGKAANFNDLSRDIMIDDPRSEQILSKILAEGQDED